MSCERSELRAGRPRSILFIVLSDIVNFAASQDAGHAWHVRQSGSNEAARRGLIITGVTTTGVLVLVLNSRSGGVSAGTIDQLRSITCHACFGVDGLISNFRWIAMEVSTRAFHCCETRHAL